MTLAGLTPRGERGARAVIRELRIAVSYQCNLRCQHCYVPEEQRSQYHKLFPDELSVEELEQTIDVMAADFGLRRISITGGEALMTPVWPRTERLLRRALRHDLKVRLITGGAGQVPVATVLAAAEHSDNLTLQVSLDGVRAESVNALRGRSYAFDRAVATIGEIAGTGTPVLVRYTVTDDNYDQTLACYDLAAELGASTFVFKPVFSAGEARRGGLTPVTPATVRELQLAAAERSVGRRTRLKLPQPCYLTAEDLPAGANVQIAYCGCGRDIAYLTPDGDVYPCTYLVGMPGMEQWRLGNLRDPEFDLARAWTAEDTYQEFRDAPQACHCTAQEIGRRSDETLACRA
ncbi:radical SAM protein [Dactylosporangium salmoneum]|uniref:radical SAM protein n=1 Tax=Dactylosporangium salmoneum TaxID=53361 RepID=UPI0031D414D7